ncbi:hypothetical protein Tco_0317853 [Tanacetum coccineum]
MQTQKSNIDTGKALDNGLVVMESNGTESEVQDDSSSNKAKIEKEIDVLETMNIELEHSVAKLRKENETLKQHYKDLYDSIKITRSKTTEQTTSLLANNAELKSSVQTSAVYEKTSPRSDLGGNPKVVVLDAKKPWGILLLKPDEEITMVSVHDMNVSIGVEVAEEVVEVINTAKLIIDAAKVSVVGDIVSAATTISAATTTTATITTIDDITLAQALEEMKSTKAKKKGIVIQKLGESTIKISSQLSLQQSQDKGKGLLIKPVKPMKKKDQISLDEETALNLQAEFYEEERLAREKVEKEEEANIALIETWDDIQAKIDADHQLSERMQAQEQEELSIKEKATLFQQLLEKRRKHFAAKRAKEK